MRTAIPASRTGPRYGVSFRSHPPTSAPQTRASNAYAESPAPPIPTSQMRRPSSGRNCDQLLGDLVRSARTGGTAHRVAHLGQPGRIGNQTADDLRHANDLGLGNDHRPTRPLEVARVLRLVVGGHVGP